MNENHDFLLGNIFYVKIKERLITEKKEKKIRTKVRFQSTENIPSKTYKIEYQK